MNVAGDGRQDSRYAALGTRALEVLTDLIIADAPCAIVDFPLYSNVGDNAIWLGERALLRRAGIPVAYSCDWRSLSKHDLLERVPHGTVLINGGGNLGDLWPHHQKFREHIVETFARHRIVQLPQSIHFDNPANLNRARSVFDQHRDLTICVRDHHSLATARANFDVHSVLCPDMAFGIEGWADAVGSAAYDIVWLSRTDHESGQRSLPPIGNNVLRIDWAKGQGATPDWNIHADIALQDYRRSAADPDARLIAADRLASLQMLRGCRILASGRVVITDRLHGHLLCLLLGLPHVILADRHGKIASMRDTWTSDWPATRWARSPDEALAYAAELAAVASGGTGHQPTREPAEHAVRLGEAARTVLLAGDEMPSAQIVRTVEGKAAVCDRVAEPLQAGGRRAGRRVPLFRVPCH